MLNRNIHISGERNGQFGAGINVRPVEKDRPNVHQRMRAWYLEGKWGGFRRYGAKCIHRGPKVGCYNDISITMNFVSINNAGGGGRPNN